MAHNNKDIFIDLHCHSISKPLGQSFRGRSGINNPNRNSKHSIWFWNRPKAIQLDKLINRALGLTKFTQADFTALHKGGCNVVVIALYPLEKGFVINRLSNGTLMKLGFGDLLLNFVTGYSDKRIDHVQAHDNYFQDLELEYEFLKQLDGKTINLDRQKVSYRIVKDIKDLNFQTVKDRNNFEIQVVLSIEGGHSLNCGLVPGEDTADAEEVLRNTDSIKSWKHRPLFITLAHHFHNELCGHAKTFDKGPTKYTKINEQQMKGLIDGPITQLGRQVINRLLENQDHNRIYIDVKHMSTQSRIEYYELLDIDYNDEWIPIIVSHGAVNGSRSLGKPWRHTTGNYRYFKNEDINFYDEELIRIAESGGIFGIQLDERRLASELELKKSNDAKKRDRKYEKARLVWRQIEHIALVLDKSDQFAWGIQSLGTDFDGIIDPLNDFWTAAEIPDLVPFLEMHAHNFINGAAGKRFNNFNQLSPTEIIDRFMQLNAIEFFQRVKDFS